MNRKIIFKPYNNEPIKITNRNMPEAHLVKIVNNAIERMDLYRLINKYKEEQALIIQ